MVWFKVDDTLAFHAKTVAAGNAAMGLWVRAGAWSSQQLTEGFIPAHIAISMGTKTEANRLVTARLWVKVEDGFQFWQWSEDGRQPTRAKVEAEREAAKKRQQVAREKAKSRRDAAVTHAVTDAVTSGVSHSEVQPPSRSPRPDPTRPETEKNPSDSSGGNRGRRLPTDWTPDQKLIDWQHEHGISDLLARRELDNFRDYWAGVAGDKGRKADWPATWRNWLRRAHDRTTPQETKTARGWWDN